jgi:hypothetical protein
MNRPLSRFCGQLVWLAASALFVAVLISAVTSDPRPFEPPRAGFARGNIR